MANEKSAPATARLIHFTPLRYPGGKAKLAPFVKELLEVNDLMDGEYAEPYAGGAGVALELLLQGYVSKIHINDISRPIYSFWSSVLNETEAFLRMLKDKRTSIAEWDRQKKILTKMDEHEDLEVGFAAFYLNCTNRSGILNGGIIGGRDQTGPWKIDARYNKAELANRIKAIASQESRIKLTNDDAVDFIKKRVSKMPKKTLVYLDPPYYVKGKQLYLSFYTPDDHLAVAKAVAKIKAQKWIVSYDNVPEIHELYTEHRRITYSLGYSAREARTGAEVMFFSKGLEIPQPIGAMGKGLLKQD